MNKVLRKRITMVLYWLIIACCFIGIIATAASLLRFDDWWIRAFDFPRVLIASILGVGLLALVSYVLLKEGGWHYGLAVVLVGCFVYQFSKIYAYTPLAPYEVLATEKIDTKDQVSLLVSNVLTPNKRSEELIQLIRDKNPDIVLTLETDKWWEAQLTVIEEGYPHTIKVPKDNLYGMHLYSRFPLVNPEVRYLMEEDIPSIRTGVQLQSGHEVIFYGLHPVPPSPTENYASTERDAELLMVAKEIEGKDESVIVAGDLNDVAWSYTTSLFQKISGLIDPRKGRGFYSTFHAKYFFMRWPLDHVFHSNDFNLLDMGRLPYIGSDHFPIFVKLQYDSTAIWNQEKPESDEEDQDLAKEKVKSAKEGKEQTLIPNKEDQ